MTTPEKFEMSVPGAEGLDKRELRLCRGLDEDGDYTISPREVEKVLRRGGLRLETDPRLNEIRRHLTDGNDRQSLSYSEFATLAQPNIVLLERALCGELIIPDFGEFTQDLEEVYQDVHTWSLELERLDREEPLGDDQSRFGKVADYIPPLAGVSDKKWGVAVCSVDGQRWSAGDSSEKFSVQSTCKPINYCLALQENAPQEVHKWVGFEPSGRGFNDVVWDNLNRPHNPLINAGAIMCSALICRDRPVETAVEDVLNLWRRLAGSEDVGLDDDVASGENDTGFQNIALTNLMMAAKKFPEFVRSKEDLNRILELYFNCCAIEASAETMATVGATLANSGICPVAGSGEETVLKPEIVRSCLSVTGSCGMYDASGQFSFDMGIPAKSGVGGGILIVIPRVLGICTWSPALDGIGNSVRGQEFCRRLIEIFSFHAYESARATGKSDPRSRRLAERIADVNELTWAASKGDLGAMKRLTARRGRSGSDFLKEADYDARTPLHLAAAESKLPIVEYLVQELTRLGENMTEALSPCDRWGCTPLDDAEHVDAEGPIAALLRKAGAENGAHDRLFPAGRFEGVLEVAASDLSEIIECIWAASEGNLYAVQRFIARGVSADAQDYDARTPLHLAASAGHLGVCAYLVRHVSDLEPRDRWGQTPLDDAIRHGHEEVAVVIKEERRRRPEARSRSHQSGGE